MATCQRRSWLPLDDRGQPCLNALARFAIGSDVLGLQNTMGHVLVTTSECDGIADRQVIALDVFGQLVLTHRAEIATSTESYRLIRTLSCLDSLTLVGCIERMRLLALLQSDLPDLLQSDNITLESFLSGNDNVAGLVRNLNRVSEPQSADHPVVTLISVLITGLVLFRLDGAQILAV